MKDKSEKEFSSTDPPSLVDAKRELIRPGNLEVGVTVSCTHIPRGTKKLALSSQCLILNMTACLTHKGFPCQSSLSTQLVHCFSYCWKMIRPKDYSVERGASNTFSRINKDSVLNLNCKHVLIFLWTRLVLIFLPQGTVDEFLSAASWIGSWWSCKAVNFVCCLLLPTICHSYAFLCPWHLLLYYLLATYLSFYHLPLLYATVSIRFPAGLDWP